MFPIPVREVIGFPKTETVSVFIEDTHEWERAGCFRYEDKTIDFVANIRDFAHTKTSEMDMTCCVFRGTSSQKRFSGKIVTLLTLFYQIEDEESYFGRDGCKEMSSVSNIIELEIVDTETYKSQYPDQPIEVKSFLNHINTG